MRKCILAFFLSACLMLVLLPPNALAVSNTSTKNEVYTAYYDLIQLRIKTIGIIEPSTVTGYDGFPSPKKEGVYYARLVDFDADGIDELFLIESNWSQQTVSGSITYDTWGLNWYVYTYANNSAKLLSKGGTLGHRPFGFTTDESGKTYFYEYTDGFSYSGNYLYFNQRKVGISI